MDRGVTVSLVFVMTIVSPICTNKHVRKTQRVLRLIHTVKQRLTTSAAVSDDTVKSMKVEKQDAIATVAPPAGAEIRCGDRVCLHRQIPANRGRFQEWYADPEIAYLLRHDLKPLTARQSGLYFDTMILPLSAAGYCFAIHDRESGEVIGMTALTESDNRDPLEKLFRIVIGEKAFWNHGFGTEATKLVVEEGFQVLGLHTIRLEVFEHNPRAITAYERVGFQRTGSHTEWVGSDRPLLKVVEMAIRSDDIGDEETLLAEFSSADFDHPNLSTWSDSAES